MPKGGVRMKRIMIIDDDKNIQQLLTNRLVANGYEVSLANDGLEALNQIEKIRPDMIILDVYMPHLDGLSFFQELGYRSELRDIPLIVMTGVKSVHDMFASARVVKFLTKPFNSNELLSNIEHCVGR
jgi:DNA-binding response OmpR family regulator